MANMHMTGQISSKQWKRLSMKQPSKFSSQKGRMAPFDEKTTGGEGGVKRKAVPATKVGHINGPDQGMGKPSHAGGKPTGPVKGGQPTVRAIDEEQKPNFPTGGVSSSSNSRKTLSHQQPSSSDPTPKGEHYYGGPSSRQSAPSRLR